MLLQNGSASICGVTIPLFGAHNTPKETEMADKDIGIETMLADDSSHENGKGLADKVERDISGGESREHNVFEVSLPSHNGSSENDRL